MAEYEEVRLNAAKWNSAKCKFGETLLPLDLEKIRFLKYHQ